MNSAVLLLSVMKCQAHKSFQMAGREKRLNEIGSEDEDSDLDDLNGDSEGWTNANDSEEEEEVE